jgi:hypothetical protein
MKSLSHAMLRCESRVEEYVEEVRKEERVEAMLGAGHVLVREVRDVEEQIARDSWDFTMGWPQRGARVRMLKCVRVRLVFCMMAELYRRDATMGAEFQAFFGLLDAQIRGTLARMTLEPYKFKYWRDVAEEEDIPFGDGYNLLYL